MQGHLSENIGEKNINRKSDFEIKIVSVFDIMI